MFKTINFAVDMKQAPEKSENDQKKNMKSWLKTIGIAGFLFFLVKGIAWIVFFYFGASFFKGCG